MKSMDIIAALKADGWTQVAQKGSQVQLKHPTKPRVTVPRNFFLLIAAAELGTSASFGSGQMIIALACISLS
ncbi:type II toxin-antitoxin system HicA family toxin [Bradyrhizobium sp. 147]|uniref:type II toxin-antitoxin system HicA family toxin n=2 Tax=unclassified Bradyrhizobium TaxID=2631580 RepID=UPI001FF7E3FE|nr:MULTISPECIES: type II toxin-antitoxin system HicA family toxin [unclassified Bradyrhizobium]MCK1424956.1 type II toxin-antitoxin system HicA family toxin [Bradyrhizobium sp. CW12]MCK1643388.1 type II toxin-antitoxin system HicA family toxin [Bradyrhizobium sp. 154]MCK1665295.1 type II toxin-antitoxin system HicA family toxin [Bradyrhizobium sp. 153]MCK1679340.1 type II toxin-antitoxin system HicA family toxin [Bradyrhizobium sp. 147]MCK1753677.1 type II toxin-antitoxin system HicA family to